MSNKAALNPRFSVKASFNGNIIDASDNEYATQKARNYPKSSGRCAVNQAQPQIAVQAPRRLQELGVPAQEDRQYWGGKTVVYQARKEANLGKVTNAPVRQQQVRAAAPQRRQPVKQIQAKTTIRNKTQAPAANPDNHVWGQEMGQRQARIQKAQRGGRRGDAVVEQNANSFVATVPRELLEGDSFVLEMPQGVWGKGVVRPSEIPLEADPLADQEVDDEVEAEADRDNRAYWKGKTIVQQGAQRCSQPQTRPIVAGPGCQAKQNALKKGEVSIRAVPKKVVRQPAPAQRQVVAKKGNAPVRKAATPGGCPCKNK